MDNDLCQQLLLSSKDGDTQAFKKLYELTSSRLYGVLVKLMPNAELAEDVLQDSYVKIWEKAESYHPSKGRALTWMITIARNRGLDVLRAIKVRPDIDESRIEVMEELTFEGLNPEALMSIDQDMGQLAHCFKGLSEEQQRVVLLSFYYGYTHQELAESSGKPLGTVKAWVRRGLEKLRDCLK